MTFLYLLLVLSAALMQSVHCVYNPPPSNCTLSPPGPKTVCGVAGVDNVRNAKLCSAQKVTDLDNCVYLCQRRDIQRATVGCQGFSFNSQTGICQLYTKPVKQFTRNSSSHDVFYDLKCFKCQPNCPIPLGENILDNGNFEASGDYLGPWGTIFPRKVGIVSPGHASQYAFNFNGTTPDAPASSSGKSVLFSQAINTFYPCDIDTGVTYLLQFDFKINPVTSASSSIHVDTGIGSYSFGVASGGTHGKWQTVVLPYFAAINIFPSVTFNINSDPLCCQPTLGNYFLDNVSLVPTKQNRTVKPSAPELIQNPGFETGKLAPWNIIRKDEFNSSIISPGLTGSFALSLQDQTDGNSFAFEQQIQTVPGTYYLFSLDYASTPGFAGFVAFGKSTFVTYQDGVGEYSQSDLDGPPAPDAPQTVTVPFIARHETTFVTIQIYGGVGFDMTLDNLSVKEWS